MNTASKTILVLLVLILAGVGAVFLLKSDEGAGGLPALTTEQPEDEPEEPDTDPIRAEEPSRPRQAGKRAERREVVQVRDSGASLPQGVKGRVVDPSGRPVPETSVHLMEGTGSDLFRMLKLSQRGVIIPPVASAVTDRSGNFALGVARVDPEKTYEVRVVSDRFVDAKVSNVRILPEQWWDAGNIQLERGVLVYGRVTVADTGGLPVPDAEVIIKENTGFPNVTPTPGRERGLVAEVDRSGSYRIENAPSGVVNISAVAPGYAKRELQNTTIDANADNQINFELPKGMSIAGLVTDASQNPVAHAKVEAVAISNKTPVTAETRSDQNGEFTIIGLVEGPYLMTAAAPGFVKWEDKPIHAGDRNVRIVLEQQGSARIRVYGKNGNLLRSYTLTVKTYFKDQEHYGHTDIPPRPGRPDRNGITTVEGLDPASYVFQVEAPGHAKAFSDPFHVAIGAEPPLVEVHMNEGGVIEGTVVAAGGKPLPGVEVQTLPNHLDDNPFTRMFRGIIPYKITQQATTTNAQGRYRFALLNPGEYQLKFSHPEHYEVYQKGWEVQTGRTTSIPTLTMYQGTVISGQIRVDGKPSGQVKVTVSAVADPQKPNPGSFNAEAISDNSGRYVIPKRVPPGRYEVMAARQTLESPLLQIADFAKTKKQFSVSRGQKRYSLNINIDTNAPASLGK